MHDSGEIALIEELASVDKKKQELVMDWQKLVYWQNGKDILSCRHVFMVKEERAVVMVMPDLHLHTSPSYVFDFCVTINVKQYCDVSGISH